MSEEQLKAFLARIKSDVDLQDKLRALTTPDEAVAMAKEAGFVIPKAELEAQLEVSDDELERLTGGVDYSSGCRSGRCNRYTYYE